MTSVVKLIYSISAATLSLAETAACVRACVPERAGACISVCARVHVLVRECQ